MRVHYLVTSASGSVHRFDSIVFAAIYGVLHRMVYGKKPMLETVTVDPKEKCPWK